MKFLVEWVGNIVVFILFATVLTMLLPNSKIGKYVKMVVGLLLITMILNPLFQLFKTDIASVLSSFQPETYIASGNIENQLNLVKGDIEGTQRAYILKQMAVQLKRQAEEEIKNEFGQDIVAIDVVPKKEAVDIQSQQEIDQLLVKVRYQSEEDSVAVVQEVVINAGEENGVDEAQMQEEYQHIRERLSEMWGIAEEKITVTQEGGEVKHE